MKLGWTVALVLGAPATAYVPSFASSASSTALHSSASNNFNSNNNGFRQPTPNFAPPFAQPNNAPAASSSPPWNKDSVFPRNNSNSNSEAPFHNSNNLGGSNSQSQRQETNHQLIVNIHSGYVTTDRRRRRTYVSSSNGGSSLAMINNNNKNNNGYRAPTSVQAATYDTEENTLTRYNYNSNSDDDDDDRFPPGSAGDVAVRALQEACDYVVTLAEENESLKRELKIMQEAEEELLNEQERLEREVTLLQDQMIQLQYRFRTLSQEEERLRGEYYLLLLEREATRLDYQEKLSLDTRLEQAELRLRQRGIYL